MENSTCFVLYFEKLSYSLQQYINKIQLFTSETIMNRHKTLNFFLAWKKLIIKTADIWEETMLCCNVSMNEQFKVIYFCTMESSHNVSYLSLH